MNVKLINQLNNMQDIANIAGICYGNESSSKDLFRKLYKLGHTSVFEHMVFTYKIEGISRACLAQLTRHRHASFTVESQRYVDYTQGIRYTKPELSGEEEEIYIAAIKEAHIAYKKLLAAGVKKEDARMVFPNAAVTNLYMTINLRSLINLLNLRLDKSAQWEIRELAAKLLSELDEELQEVVKEGLVCRM